MEGRLLFNVFPRCEDDVCAKRVLSLIGEACESMRAHMESLLGHELIWSQNAEFTNPWVFTSGEAPYCIVISLFSSRERIYSLFIDLNNFDADDDEFSVGIRNWIIEANINEERM
ncbi:MAG: hypothetical protein PHY72_00205 [Candidatus Pacebacteria bacterium]|nr:hypothetical protein [Candidatus Paceibacterota bacterium]